MPKQKPCLVISFIWARALPPLGPPGLCAKVWPHEKRHRSGTGCRSGVWGKWGRTGSPGCSEGPYVSPQLSWHRVNSSYEDRQCRLLRRSLRLHWNKDSAPWPLSTRLGFGTACTSLGGHGGAVQDPPPPPFAAVGWGRRGSGFCQGSVGSEGSMHNYDVYSSPSSQPGSFAPAHQERDVRHLISRCSPRERCWCDCRDITSICSRQSIAGW